MVNYKLSDKESDNNVNTKDVKDSDKQDSKSESSNATDQGDNDGNSRICMLAKISNDSV